MNDLTTALAEIVALRAAISNIQNLHHENPYGYCDECVRVAAEKPEHWPCPTITAIGKATP